MQNSTQAKINDKEINLVYLLLSLSLFGFPYDSVGFNIFVMRALAKMKGTVIHLVMSCLSITYSQ